MGVCSSSIDEGHSFFGPVRFRPKVTLCWLGSHILYVAEALDGASSGMHPLYPAEITGLDEEGLSTASLFSRQAAGVPKRSATLTTLPPCKPDID